MESKIHAGLRVLYKDSNSGWKVGIVDHQKAEVDEKGVWIAIIPIEFASMDAVDVPYVHHAEINNIFTDGEELEDYIKNLPEVFMTKEDYIKIIEADDETFVKALENAYVSDGEYYYYPVSKFTRTWIEKQPFNYIVRFQ